MVTNEKTDFFSVLLLFISSLQTMQSHIAFTAKYPMMKKMDKPNFSVNSRKWKNGKKLQSSLINSLFYMSWWTELQGLLSIASERERWWPGVTLCPPGFLALPLRLCCLSIVVKTTSDMGWGEMPSWALHIFNSLIHHVSIPNPIIGQEHDV